MQLVAALWFSSQLQKKVIGLGHHVPNMRHTHLDSLNSRFVGSNGVVAIPRAPMVWWRIRHQLAENHAQQQDREKFRSI